MSTKSTSKSTLQLPGFAKNYSTTFFSKWTGDWFLAIVFFALGGTIATIFYHKIGYTFFYQNFVPEAILWACGHEFLFPKQTITELIPFLKGQALSFDCKTLPALDLHDTTSEFAGVQPYLTWSVAVLWKWFGVNYRSLSPLIFVLWGAYTSGIYLLFRQFCNKWVAVLAALFICCSPVMIHMIGSLRDFSKAPFIIWALFLLIRTIKQPVKQGLKAYVPPILAGAIAGIGMGFRSDLFFLLPIGTIFLLIGFSNPQINSFMGQIISRVKIGIVFAAAFVIFASPILKNGGPGGVGGVFIMQGMSEPFRKNLKLEPGSYTTGWAYSDELTLSSIAASEREKDPEKWDKKEQSGIPGISISQTMHLGTPNLLQWADLFIGDFATQAIKSFTWIVGLPLYISNSGFVMINPYPDKSPQGVIYNGYQKLSHPIILLILLAGFFSLLFHAYLHSKSECIALAFLLIFLGAYPGIQFHFRHFFYLEFIWILCIIFFLYLTQLVNNHKKQFIKFFSYITICIIPSVALYVSIIQYQKIALSMEINRLLQQPRESVSIEKNVTNSEGIFISIPVPPKALNLVNSRPDSMTPAMEFIGSEWDVRSEAFRYLLTVSGPDCTGELIPMKLKYKHTNETWQPLDSTFFLSQPETRSLLFSSFYRPTQFFEGISISKQLTRCEFKLEKIIGKSKLPYFFAGSIENGTKEAINIKSLGQYSK
jgi:hypothetical protein